MKSGGPKFPGPGLPGRKRTRSVLALFYFCFSLNLLVLPSGAGEGDEKMTDKVIWPTEINGWQWDKENRTYNRETLFDHIDGGAEVYLAYNFKQATVHRYQNPGYPDIVAEVYKMGSSEDAFGVFSLERQDPEAGIGQNSEFGGSLLRFWKGPHFVSVLGEGAGKAIETAVLRLGRELDLALKETGPPPRILGLLPDLPSLDRLCFVHSHVLLNRCFFLSHSNLLRLDRDVQAALGRYVDGTNKIRVLLILYPSETRARSAFNGFRAAYMPEAGQSHAVKTEDGTWTKAETHQKWVIIVFGTNLESQAETLIRSTVTKLQEDGL
jgi:hypothetical protein